MFSSSLEKRESPSSRLVCPTELPPLTAFRSASQTAWRLLVRTEKRESHIRRGTLHLTPYIIFSSYSKYLNHICWGKKGSIIILWALETHKKPQQGKIKALALCPALECQKWFRTSVKLCMNTSLLAIHLPATNLLFKIYKVHTKLVLYKCKDDYTPKHMKIKWR